MSSAGSVTDLISRLKTGDALAARQLWELYFAPLRRLARQRLSARSGAVADDEDVAISALASFFLGAENGHFPQVHDRDDLWRALAVITIRKALDLLAHENRQKRRPPPNGAGCLDEVADPNLPPDIEVLVEEEYHRLLDVLGDARLRSIAVWKLEGYTNEEIAMMLGCEPRTVERKLRLIRSIWSQEARG
jgi:DNA-directed RNA polymerase specialized sigma24 family protein